MVWYSPDMATRRSKQAKPPYDWYLAEWLETCGKIQADLEKELDWNKSKASLMMNREQRYHRDDVNEVADWLHIKPYELLMHPSDAMALRSLRETAVRIAASNSAPDRNHDKEIPSIPVRKAV